MLRDYLNDIEIARTAIYESKLFPKGQIVMDLYAIPSHNHQAYYAVMVSVPIVLSSSCQQVHEFLVWMTRFSGKSQASKLNLRKII